MGLKNIGVQVGFVASVRLGTHRTPIISPGLLALETEVPLILCIDAHHMALRPSTRPPTVM